MDFCDVLHSVPHLLTVVTSDGGLTQLQAVSRNCRTLVHRHVRHLHLHLQPQQRFWRNRYSKEQHLQTLVAGFWPNLQSFSLHIPYLDAESARLLRQAQWPALQELEVVTDHWSSGCMTHISKMQPDLCQLTLMSITGAVDAEVIQLTQLDWPQLQRLKIHNNLYGQHSLSSLGTWPVSQQIQQLDLSCCNLCTADLQNLALHRWPVLERLDLHSNSFDSHFLRVLCEAGFPCLEELDLSNCISRLYQVQAVTLFPTSWPRMRILKLFADGIDAMTMSELIQIECPLLKVYDLSANECTARMVQSLVCCYFPNLTQLDLSWGCLDVAGVHELVKGSWPSLSQLDVNGSDLCVEAVSCILSCSSWPLLRFLDMSRNRLTTSSVICVNGGQMRLDFLHIDNGTIPAWLLAHWPRLEWVNLRHCQVPRDEF